MRADDKDSPSTHRRIQYSQLNFLGAEFLTWLYFHLEEETVQLKLGDAPVELRIGNRMSLGKLEGNEVRVQVASPALSDSGEVLQAIRSGAYVDALALDMVVNDRLYSFTLMAKDGAISGVKIQQFFPDEDGNKTSRENKSAELETTLLLRMSSLENIEEIVDALYKEFISRRLMLSVFSSDVSSIRQAVLGGLKAKLGMVQ